jgi:hypothetical protein
LAEGVQTAMLVGVGVAILGGILALFIRRPATPAAGPSDAPGDHDHQPAEPDRTPVAV